MNEKEQNTKGRNVFVFQLFKHESKLICYIKHMTFLVKTRLEDFGSILQNKNSFSTAPKPMRIHVSGFISSVKSQKGAITIQRCSVENQKGVITRLYFVP